MIEYIKGEIVELTPTRMILECGGIGYELNISLNTYSAFGNKTTGKIYIYTARMILSSLPPSELVQVIGSKNEAALTAVKGIGLKTAQRILVDLKNKVKPMESMAGNLPEASVSNGAVTEEAVAALVMLGFQKAASQKAVSAILKGSPTLAVEQVIKTALRML